ncbi:hypothetical protein ATM97_27860 [Nocardia sp. MH4]|uniref:hypothetical protein n=1 Tax=Nocardia sp. MH4 TaxID=1768677 RepID=UPI001C4F14DC|nr:hypothetical protein [Nocardia sp. MH4]MBW0275021.1 hypothetical protein [Nocardia sp. MH4]
MTDHLHAVEITGDPDNVVTWRIKFTCHGDSTAPCHRYPDCDCETWPYDESEHEHPYVGHDRCWMQDWFDNDAIDPSTDTLDEGDYRPGMSGPISARPEVPDYIEWHFTTEEGR